MGVGGVLKRWSPGAGFWEVGLLCQGVLALSIWSRNHITPDAWMQFLLNFHYETGALTICKGVAHKLPSCAWTYCFGFPAINPQPPGQAAKKPGKLRPSSFKASTLDPYTPAPSPVRVYRAKTPKLLGVGPRHQSEYNIKCGCSCMGHAGRQNYHVCCCTLALRSQFADLLRALLQHKAPVWPEERAVPWHADTCTTLFRAIMGPESA